MPYMTAGIALGNIEHVSTGTGNTARNTSAPNPIPGGPPILTPIPGQAFANTAQVRHRGISYGGAIGAGVDMAFFSNVFLRAEWQYIQFAKGGNRPEVSINTARVAGAVKF
jgi:opacity protein-like surface antigen